MPNQSKVLKNVLTDVKSNLSVVGFKTYIKPDITKDPLTFGYYFQTIPEEVKNLWFGFIKDREHSGLYLRAMPKSETSTRRLLHEGYKYATLWTPQFWLVKRFISNKGIEKLLRISDKEKKQYLRCIIENTYPL
ncbi:MAG: hypothetical protein V1709_05985 [Planctomycetota bacterium]